MNIQNSAFEEEKNSKDKNKLMYVIGAVVGVVLIFLFFSLGNLIFLFLFKN